MKNFYYELPEGYKEIKVIDAKNKKTIIYMNLASVGLMLAAILPFLFIKPINIFEQDPKHLYISIFIMAFGMILYIVLHELVHGFWYKIMTKEKLTFGMTLSVAFCGVPHIYVNKKTALLAITGPFILFSIIFIPLLILMPANAYYFALVIIFGMHISGCSGDLYGTLYLLSQKGDLLMNDTGPKQSFYKLDK
jgi:hypothetical protein